MKVIASNIPDVKIIEPTVFGDNRGYFFESWNCARYVEAGIDCNWVQDNESSSSYGVLRGLHPLFPQVQPRTSEKEYLLLRHLPAEPRAETHQADVHPSLF